MLENESDGYPIQQISKIILSSLYDGNNFVGYQKKIIFHGGYYHKKIYDSNKLLLSHEKFAPNDILTSAEFYQNNKIIRYIETDIDSNGIRHEIILDANHKTISHKKFDKLKRFIGGGIYENGNFIGNKIIRYTENGVYETNTDATYRVISEVKINPEIYANTEQKQLQEIVLETHVRSHTKNGEIYETVFDGMRNIISKPRLIQKAPEKKSGDKQTVLPNTTTTMITEQKACHPNLAGKIVTLLKNFLNKPKTL